MSNIKKKKPYIAEGSKIAITFPDGDEEIATYKNGLLIVKRDTYFFEFELGNILKCGEMKLKKLTN